VNHARSESSRWLAVISICGGVLLTFVLTLFALAADSRVLGCTFAWQACLVQTVIHTPDNPLHEGSPIDVFGFLLGVLLGVPIYSVLSYGAILLWRKAVGETGDSPEQRISRPD
jgi:hypothetical protein